MSERNATLAAQQAMCRGSGINRNRNVAQPVAGQVDGVVGQGCEESAVTGWGLLEVG